MSMFARVLFLLTLASAAAQAATPTYLASGDLGNNNGSTSNLTTSFTASATTPSALFVLVRGDDISNSGTSGGADDITSVTYNSVAMTLIGKVINRDPTGNNATGQSYATSPFTYLYFLNSPATGANNVSVSSSAIHYLAALVGQYQNVAWKVQDKTASATFQGSPTTGAAARNLVLPATAANTFAIVGATGYTNNSPMAATTNVTRRVVDATFGELGLFDTGVITGSTTATITWVADPTGQNYNNVLLGGVRVPVYVAFGNPF
jgi:hypothetical protein